LAQLDDFEACVLKAAGNIFWLADKGGKMKDYCLERVFGVRGDNKRVEIIFLKVEFHG
jgi:hypothetical protein